MLVVPDPFKAVFSKYVFFKRLITISYNKGAVNTFIHILTTKKPKNNLRLFYLILANCN